MRLLLVSDVDPCRVVGGAERLLAGHAKGLACRGHDVIVCSGAPGPTEELGPRPVLRVGRDPATPVRAAALVRAHRPDVVVGYQPACALGVLRAARRRGLPALYVFLSSWAEEYATRRPRPRRVGRVVRQAAERACLRASDAVVVLSAYSAATLASVHPGAGPVRVIPGGVDGAHFCPDGGRLPARARLGLAAEGPVLVAVRNLVPRMGLDNLISAIPEVARAFPEVRLVIAGEGPLRPALEAQAAALDLGNRVLLRGFVPEDQLPEYYRAADLALVPSRDQEGFGLATVEALACGTPVLGTPVGATPEILGPLDPRLLAEGTWPDALATAITELLRDPPCGLPERARRHVLDRYTWDAAAAGLEAVIEERTQ